MEDIDGIEMTSAEELPDGDGVYQVFCDGGDAVARMGWDRRLNNIGESEMQVRIRRKQWLNDGLANEASGAGDEDVFLSHGRTVEQRTQGDDVNWFRDPVSRW